MMAKERGWIMKTGIMTMHRIDNYGSFLQALGLKLELERLGGEVSFVDFKVHLNLAENKWLNRFPLRQLRVLKRPVARDVIYPPSSNNRTYQSILGLDDTLHFRSKVDVLVVGSDEVFNYCQTNPCVGYAPQLLGAGNRAGRVVSYAACCGNLNVEKLEKYGKVSQAGRLLGRFDALSVRDEATGRFVETLTGRKPEYHLDPVLVADFGSAFQEEVEEKDYVLTYGYPSRFTREEGEAIQAFARRRGKRILSLCGRQSFCDAYVECSPLQIMAYFRQADCIITDTFHGTIFSALNHKQFVTLSRSDAQVWYGNENKVLDLLARLGLEGRRLTQLEGLEEQMEKPIDYEGMDRLLERERQRTRDYLRRSVFGEV